MKKSLIVVLFLLFTQSIVLGIDFSDLIDKNSTVIIKKPNGENLISINGNKVFIPASTLKILTALASIENLGSDYRFKTQFLLSRYNDLIIRGYGDPILVSEVISSVSKKLSNILKPIKIRNIILDGTFFETGITIPGVTDNSSQPYDASNGAICSNFNTVFFKRLKDGNYVSAENQTPLLNFVNDRIQKSGLDSGRVKLNSEESSLYTGFLFRYFLKKNGVFISGIVKNGSLFKKKDLRLIYNYRSVYSLEDVVKKLMLFSNNFIANQIFITLGAEKKGAPGNLLKGSLVVSEYLKKNGKVNVTFLEGSGISRSNRISGNNLITILSMFKKHYRLLKNEGTDYFKTGTMKDISSRAGFIIKDEKLYSYIIIVNGRDAFQRLTKIHKNIKKLIK